MTAHTPKRRTVLKAGAWAAPAVLATAAIPAYAASTPISNLTDLAIELGQPSMDWSAFEPIKDVPIYFGATGTTIANPTSTLFNPKPSYGSLPKTMTITNVGTVPAVNPTGTLLTQMKDAGTDAVSSAIIGTQVNSTNPLIVFNYTGQGTPNGPTYSWIYSGTLNPGESVEIPLRYYVTRPFANVDYELFVAVTVEDQMDGDYDDTMELMGTVNGFIA